MNNYLSKIVEKLKSENRLIFETIAGSNLYNLQTEASDLDIRGVFINSFEEQHSLLPVADEYSDDKSDIKYYSLFKFFKLASEINPNVCELIFIPEHKLLFKNEVYDLIHDNRHLFISKKAQHSFCGYAYSQIQRAKGKNKKANDVNNFYDENTITYHQFLLQEDDGEMAETIQRVCGMNYLKYLYKVRHKYEDIKLVFDHTTIKTRPQPEEFCYFVYLNKQNKQPFRAITADSLESYDCSAVDHFPNVYRLYKNGKGVFHSNQLSTASITLDREESDFVGVFCYNEDAYKSAIKEWDSYWEWQLNKSEARYEKCWDKDTQFDTKNMSHTVRLLLSAENIAINGEPLVFFPDNSENNKLLRDIRNGKYSYEYILKFATDKMENLKVLFEKSTIPHSTNIKKINDLYMEICKMYWKN